MENRPDEDDVIRKMLNAELVHEAPPPPPPHDNSNACRLHVFHYMEPNHDQDSSSNNSINEKVKCTLKKLELAGDHTDHTLMIQFWLARTFGSHMCLGVNGQPFGLNQIETNLCAYRKKCEKDEIVVDNGETNVTPFCRVFKTGSAEWTPHISEYNSTEFPNLDLGLKCSLEGFLCLPVFNLRSHDRDCVGVIELITSSSKDDGFEEDINALNMKLQGNDLGTDIRPFNFVHPVCWNFELVKEFDRISLILHNISIKYSLPLAQTWSFSQYGSYSTHQGKIINACCSYHPACIGVNCLSMNGLPTADPDPTKRDFHSSCKKIHLTNKKSFVWKTLSTKTSNFCPDVKKATHDEFLFVEEAKKHGLEACLNVYISGLHEYVLEFYFPPGMRDTTIFEHDLKELCEKDAVFKIGSSVSESASVGVAVVGEASSRGAVMLQEENGIPFDIQDLDAFNDQDVDAVSEWYWSNFPPSPPAAL